MDKLERDLKAAIEGEVRFDSISKQVYSVDASIYEVEPIGIVLPKTKQDLANAVKIANAHGVPVIARGAATGITGGCLGSGLIIDTSKYLNQILEINIGQEYAICEPGVVQDRLNDELGKQGYRLGPDTSTGNRATIGGMVGNNAAGARSLKYGCMAAHVREIELILANGETVHFCESNETTWHMKCSLPTTEGNIYKRVNRIKNVYTKEIIETFPNIPRRVSGYNLNSLIEPFPLNICKLITGSEGTLGIASQIKVKICPKIKASALCIVHFHDMIKGMHSLHDILQYNPIALEMIDSTIISMGRLSPTMSQKLNWLSGDPEAVFVVEFEGDTASEAEKKARYFSDAMQKQNIGYAAVCLIDPILMSHVWEVRKAGLTLLLSKRSYQRAIAFIEDLSVPPSQLPNFLEDFCRYLKQEGKTAGIYGHAGAGCMHIRPYMDLRKQEDLSHMEKMMNDVSDLILRYKGSMSGEHGDGLVRSWLNKKMFGGTIYQAFVDLKHAFDPDNRMNPGKIVHPSPFLEHLRLSPATPIHEPITQLDFSREGGFSLAVDLCNGNGLCRKKEKTMCPSFQATEDEYHSTRARAQTLRGIIHGKLSLNELSGEGLHDVLDLCLQCKGCKTECPSQVDMAKMKAEHLYHYHEEHGISLRDRMLANIHTFDRIASVAPSLFNRLMAFRGTAFLLEKMGIASERQLPLLAKQSFSKMYKKIKHFASREKVVLFVDTFNEYHTPEVGMAAIRVLNQLGYEAIIIARECCGRPLISKGLLKQAKKLAERLVKRLEPFAREGIPIIGLEPSCLLTIKDDFFGLLGYTHKQLDEIAKMSITFDEFVAGHIKDGKLPLKLAAHKQHVLVHGHCHQKALVGMESSLAVLKAIPDAVVNEIPSGCCGMAGAFGYEAEHYDISMKIGELQLFPAIRKSEDDSVIIANGFSCRHQIIHGTAKHPLHLAELLNLSSHE